MKNKLFIILLAGVIWDSASVCAQSKHEKLSIYLPREITIASDNPTLGQIAILRGDETIVARATEIPIGRISTPDQVLVLNKNIVLSRLASNGIRSSVTSFSGAEETKIKRQNRIIASQEFLQKADSFLKNNLPDDTICGYDALNTPADLVLAGSGENLTLDCRLVEHNSQNQCKVVIAAFADKKEIACREVVFRFKYRFSTVKTIVSIAKGEVITKENAQAQEVVSNAPQPSGWTPPFGLVAARSMPAGTVVTANMINSPVLEVLLKRNQSVSIKIERGGLLASANGKALQDGAAGEYIKVQNVDSKVVIVAKVNQDGTVEPVF